MIFATPIWLWALLVVPAIPLLERWATGRDQERLARVVARALWGRVLDGPRSRFRPVRITLLTLAAAGLVLALARPQLGIVREKIEREGVDVVLALDTSRSMATEDVAPNRFFLAKAALLSLVTRLEGDRLALLAFEGEAFPLVPLTLDADAVGLFLETLEPGAMPTSGSSIGAGLTKALEMFVDKERHNKVLVLVSDGEDLDGQVEAALGKAKEAGVVVHAVGIGTERGEPVPDVDAEGNRAGFKKDENGTTVISHMNPQMLQQVASSTGGRFFRITAADSSLAALATAIESLEQRSASREFSYRKKERFQWPLGFAFLCLVAALGLPLPRRSRRPAASAAPVRKAAAVLLAALLLPTPRAHAEPKDEVLLRPKRLTNAGRREYAQGNHPQSLKTFEDAAKLRPQDARLRFNVADALYKNGKYDEAEPIFRALGADPKSPVAAESRFNLGNTLFQKKDYPGAVQSYVDALRVRPNDEDTRRNLEMALRAIEQQKQQQKQDPKKQTPTPTPRPQPQDKKNQQGTPPPPKSDDQKEQERFQNETGMPRDRAMQLLDALQQNEKEEQKRDRSKKANARGKGRADW